MVFISVLDVNISQSAKVAYWKTFAHLEVPNMACVLECNCHLDGEQ
jgi:hypothetical protein